MSGEEMLHCPYNYSHVIMKSRMASHLIKCRQQFPLENYTTCPFNSTHDVPVPELKYHVDTCPDRKTMENFLYVVDQQSQEEEAPPAEVPVPNLEENWDDENTTGSYLEKKDKVLEEQLFFRPPAGRSKSEKKAFLQSQVKKFQKGDAEKSTAGPSTIEVELKPHKSGSINEEECSINMKKNKSGPGRGVNITDPHY